MSEERSIQELHREIHENSALNMRLAAENIELLVERVKRLEKYVAIGLPAIVLLSVLLAMR